jgi:hypothetical protein
MYSKLTFLTAFALAISPSLASDDGDLGSFQVLKVHPTISLDGFMQPDMGTPFPLQSRTRFSKGMAQSGIIFIVPLGLGTSPAPGTLIRSLGTLTRP